MALIDGFFKKYVEGFIFHDIQEAINREANYLAALGILSYIDYLALLIFDEPTKPRYIKYLRKYMKDYKPYDGIYEVRSGFVHQYFPPRIETVSMKLAGRKYGSTGPAVYRAVDGKWKVVVEPLFEDFKKGAYSMKIDLMLQKEEDFVKHLQKILHVSRNDVLNMC